MKCKYRVFGRQKILSVKLLEDGKLIILVGFSKMVLWKLLTSEQRSLVILPFLTF